MTAPLCAILLLAAPVLADPWQTLPDTRTDLTAVDQARVQQITQAASTFTQAEPYEVMSVALPPRANTSIVTPSHSPWPI